jgi:hypothetical protein
MMGWGDRRALRAVMDVAVWGALALQYEAAFRDNKINERVLPSLTAQSTESIRNPFSP